eukprot:3422636-Rhodomonas_salina.1
MAGLDYFVQYASPTLPPAYPGTTSTRLSSSAPILLWLNFDQDKPAPCTPPEHCRLHARSLCTNPVTAQVNLKVSQCPAP